ncbi:MAG: RIP metalloprotease RseP [Proteobacteria bacterium]|nr:RIP metalloprotease RseP [Pseudomonadota bacterium]
MSLLQTILAFVVLLGVLIVIHELGHYWVARWCGVKVLRFSVGMGKVIYSRRIGPDQTEWAISILPFGGYVKMLDSREEDLGILSEADLKREFTRQNVWKRIAIVAAGPIANFLLAIAIFAGLYSYGIPEPAPRLRAVPEKSAAYDAGLRGGELITAVNGESVKLWSDLRWTLLQPALEKKTVQLEVQRPADEPGKTVSYPVSLALASLSTKDLEADFLLKLGIDLARPKAILNKVLPDGPGMRAGLQDGDVVLAVDDKPIADGVAFVELMRASPEKNLALRVLRGREEVNIRVTPNRAEVDGHVIGQIKVEMAGIEMATATYSPIGALGKGIERTWETSVLTLKMLGKMLIGEVSWKNITGPITIAEYAGKTASIGMISYLTYMALISLSLGVMNLLPIPVLDGGLLLYYALEVLTGKPLSERFGEIAQRAGVGILMALMMVAIFNDISRHIP